MSLRREIARYHTVALTNVKRPALSDQRIYVLYLLNGSESKPIAFIPIVEYLLRHGRSRSAAWQREVCRSVGLFADYLLSNEIAFKNQTDRPQVLAQFAEALVSGTIDLEGNDESGLYWEPKKQSRAQALLNLITSFFDDLVNLYQTTPINPWRTADMAERMAYWRRFDNRRAHDLLAHATGRDESIQRSLLTRTVSIHRKPIINDVSPAKFFPKESIWKLLEQGFSHKHKTRSGNTHEQLNIRDMLITILLHGGGLRESEPFHIYVSDIAIDPRNGNNALVRLYHPESGLSPDDYIDPISGNRILATREEYLRTKWQLKPRTLSIGRFHAGWKDLKLTNGKENYALVHWFPSYWSELFLILFKIYITKLRSRHCNHPFLFVSHKENFSGDPYTIDSYRQSHARAVNRIGLIARKELGTTPHGHRHAYAQQLTDLKVNDEIIQAALHHKSLKSQQVYKEPTSERVNSALKSASDLLDMNSFQNQIDRLGL